MIPMEEVSVKARQIIADEILSACANGDLPDACEEAADFIVGKRSNANMSGTQMSEPKNDAAPSAVLSTAGLGPTPTCDLHAAQFANVMRAMGYSDSVYLTSLTKPTECANCVYESKLK